MNDQRVGNLKVLSERECRECGEPFLPKPGGYNARYCTNTCKLRRKRAVLKSTKPEQLRNARVRSYNQTKKHPERMAAHRAGCRNYRARAREWLAQYKLKHGCVDCGYSDHYAALQLDHEGEKSVEIADARSSIARLEAEIERGECVVRCANCHSIKTWERKQESRR